MARTRVLIAEDSATVRSWLRKTIATDPELEVVGEAHDGRQAIELCQKHRPDVITMDMMLPGTDGLAAIEHIMAHYPTPILVVSASLGRHELFKTYDALAAGAVDVLDKLAFEQDEDHWAPRFLQTLKIVARVPVITHPRGRLSPRAAAPRSTAIPSPSESRSRPAIVAIGASTGGPGAVLRILQSLSGDLTIPVLVVIHINRQFGFTLAEWLDSQTSHRVKLATDGQRLRDLAGQVILAPPDTHLEVRANRLRLTLEPERHSCRPSIDVLFESVARDSGPAALGCLLTGMGRDGARGLLAIRAMGGHTIAQDEATSVIYGMPREAASIGAAVQILPLQDIGPAIASHCR
jgi:two-component system chemotaxis response regulator CheB